MKTIWIINHYAGNNEVGLEYRHFLIAKELKNKGYNVFIIASSYTHLLKKEVDILDEYELRSYDDIPFLWIKTPTYNGNGFSRFKNMFLFSYRLQRKFKEFDILNPDFVIASSPHPFSILNGYFISKYYNAKFIFEERDLWPMSIVELLGVSKFHPMILLFQWLEDFAYKKSCLILSPLVNLEKNIILRKKNHKEFLYLPNGILIEDMKGFLELGLNVDNYIPDNKFIIGFAGTIGASNCVDILLESAKKLSSYDIGFIIIGNGEMFDPLSKFVKVNNLCNVHMLGKKNKALTINILNRCDVLYNAVPNISLYNYGLSAIKLPEYMYLEKYIINAVSIDNDIVEIANCGSTIKNSNVESLTREVKKLNKMDRNLLDEFGKRGKEYVKNNLTYPFLVEKLISKLNKLK